MQRSTKIAVAGATGRVGRPVVDILESRGYDVVPISRSQGVDVMTGEGLDQALTGVETIIDVATGPSPDQQAATELFTTATRNLQEAGVRRLVVVSIIGIDEFAGGYNAAKVAQEQAALAGPIPARIVRAAQVHEFVEELWCRRGRSPRRSSNWPPRLTPSSMRPRPRRSPGRARNVSSRRRSCWPRAAARACASRRRAIPPPRQRALRERGRPARTGRQARRPDLRGVAGRDGARQPGLARVAGSGGAGPRRHGRVSRRRRDRRRLHGRRPDVRAIPARAPAAPRASSPI